MADRVERHDGELAGRVALITGASRGIGLAIARRFAREGATVVLSSRKQEALDAAVDDIAAEHPHAELLAFAANAGDPDAAVECVEATVERFGAVDVLVNNAATNPWMGPTIDAELRAWDKTFEVNLRGPFVWTQAAWHASMRERGGVVLNMSSIGGLHPEGSIGVYNTTKAALVHLTKQLARELAPGVRVNALAPGLIRTDLGSVIIERVGPDLASRFPLARVGEVADVAEAALFLASDRASWITGHTLVIDGGGLVMSTHL